MFGPNSKEKNNYKYVFGHRATSTSLNVFLFCLMSLMWWLGPNRRPNQRLNHYSHA